jgi:hypothetical protein
LSYCPHTLYLGLHSVGCAANFACAVDTGETGLLGRWTMGLTIAVAIGSLRRLATGLPVKVTAGPLGGWTNGVVCISNDSVVEWVGNRLPVKVEAGLLN